ncbi:MAG TPA: L,D-transpeptidase [candidate division Zixibacteria bacterium]|nr:L,D-transpeptidase [candidate division Zixibacteria bacterium]MDD4917458.1 L,D-transpeptidase [candidate division Zixibacteria bacterium]MDM7972327.1 L,D-transpeptidase [candidate division Zixibacteria bacterium]HOD66849.1 L,D-transpeptidase [candidate division Zixibacteria bacterium]HOZ06813.1 L,D-transpeptidase [candidate division Zixibacteria bacterium]
MRRTLRRLTFAAVLIGGLGGCEDAPEGLYRQADSAVRRVRTQTTGAYADSLLRQADSLLLSGRLEMARQNGRIGPFRDFAAAESLLTRALQTAVAASDSAKVRHDRARDAALARRDELLTELKTWREALNGFLRLHGAEKRLTNAELGLQIGRRLIDSGKYAEAMEVMDDVRDSLGRIRDIVDEYMRDESRHISTWRRWVNETIQESRATGTSALIVDKAAHRAYLVSSGRLVKSWPADLGHNPSRQKLFAGDGATPEGMYRVTEVRRRGSKYYRALMLNYPNELDRRRFMENKKAGVISSGAKIGGLIEVHGEGGQNRDWTDGCVALSNEDIDELFQHVQKGMPVTIVRRSDKWP